MAGFYLFELDGTLTKAGRDATLELQRAQRARAALDPPAPAIVPADLAPYLKLPTRIEARTLTRARMAREIERAMSAENRVTREDLERAGFTGVEIADHFTEAARIAGAARMVT